MTPRNPQPGEPERKKVGHNPTKLTDKLQDNLCALLEVGNYFEPACIAVGIHPSTAYRWMGDMADKDHPEGIYRAFREAVTRACAQAEVNAVNIIMAAAAGTKDKPGDYRAALELLRRRQPARWGDTQKIKFEDVEIERFTEQVLQVVRTSLESTIPDAQLRKRALAAVLGGLAGLQGSSAPAGTGA